MDYRLMAAEKATFEIAPGKAHDDLDPYATTTAGEDAPAHTQPPGDITEARAAWEPVVEGFGRRFPDHPPQRAELAQIPLPPHDPLRTAPARNG